MPASRRVAWVVGAETVSRKRILPGCHTDMGAKQRRQDQGTGPEEREKNIGWIGRLLTAWRVSDDERNERRERKKTDNPREGWEDGTPPPHRDFKMNVEPNESKPLGALGVQSVTAHPGPGS